MSQIFKSGTGGGGAGVLTLTGNTGGPVGPDGLGNINVVGTGSITVTDNPGTNTLTISSSGGGSTTIGPYIVGPTLSDFTTIQAAINAANAAGASATSQANIYVKPGTYTENLTIFDGINILSLMENYSGSLQPLRQRTSVVLAGVITADINATYFLVSGITFIPSGTVIIITLQANGSTTGVFKNCYSVINSGFGNDFTFFNSTGSGSNNVYFDSCSINIGGSSRRFTSALADNTNIIINNSFININSSSTVTTNGLIMNIEFSFLNTQLNITGDLLTFANYSTVEGAYTWSVATSGFYLFCDCSGTFNFPSSTSQFPSFEYCDLQAASFTNPTFFSVNCTSVNVVDGGIVQIQQMYNVTNPVGNYQVLHTDYFIGAAPSSTITLPAITGLTGTGATFVIKDITGGAAGGNITVSGNSINIDGAATSVITTNYGSITVTYNGTTWSIT